MAKSLRSKRKKRLRTLRREIVKPFYDKKDEAKLAAQDAALAAPKVPVRVPVAAEDDAAAAIDGAPTPVAMEVEVSDGGDSTGVQSNSLLKPKGGIGKKKSKKKLKVKGRKHGNKFRRRKI